MAVDTETGTELDRGVGLRLARLKGRLFEVALVASTLVGIVSLLVLFGYIAFDAFRPRTASIQWYLVYFGTLVAPASAFTLYARRHPAVRAKSGKAFAAVFGGILLTLVTYAVLDAVSPYDVVIYAVGGGIPPLTVYAYARKTGERTYSGPAYPAAVVLGLAMGAGLFDVVRPLVGIAAAWIAYYVLVTVPVAVGTGILVARRFSRGSVPVAVSAVLGGGLLVAVGALTGGVDPSFPVVAFSLFVVPVGYVVGEAIVTDAEGRVGLAGPFVLLGGTLLGASLVGQFGVGGPETFLTPELLLNSWDGLNARNAGIYPPIIGSIVVVGFMMVLTIPVGVGAAVYLEEYAPESGLRGRLATILEVNISNLAGVPSVVYGLLGLALFRNALGFGTGIVFSAAGTLGLLILPIVVVSTQEALRSVPDSLRQASYGMGASRWQTLRNVVLPEAVPGTLTGTILSLARAIGETAPLVIIAVATTTFSAPSGLFSSAAALPLQIFAARSNAIPEFRHGVVPAAAVVLLALMLLMNATAIVIRNRYDREG
ncbi:MAG: phosphate ABC transporter permease PstA [Haloferacaceae archaeon]